MGRNLVSAGKLLVVFCLAFVLFAPAASARWARTFGTDQGLIGSLLPSVLGGYYLAGYTELETESTWHVARIDSSGVVAWAKKLPGTGDNFSVAMELSDGSFFVQGETTLGTGKGTNALWAKFTSSFSPVWQYAFGGDGSEYLAFYPTSDGGFIGGGLSTSYGDGQEHMLVIKLNSSGGISWSKVLSIADTDRDFDILEVSDGYVMKTTILTETMGIPDGGQDVVLIKLNTSGAVQWAKHYKPADKSINSAVVSLTSDGNLLLAGSDIPTFSWPMDDKINDLPIPSFTSDMFLMKVSSSNGSILWDWKYGDETSMLTGIMAWENADGTFSYSGFRPEVTSGTDMDSDELEVKGNILILQLSSAGAINSQNMTTNDDIYGLFYKQHDGTYHLVGSQVTLDGEESDMDVLYGKFDSSLNPVWVKTFGGDKTDMGALFNISGQYFLSGTTLSFASGKSTIFGITLDSTGEYPDCQPYFEDFTVTWGTPQLAKSDLGRTAESVTPQEIAQPYSPESVSMTVETVTLSTTDICGSTPPEGIVYVGKEGCGGHTPCVSSITDGISSAEDNGTIKVGEGTYSGDVLMNVTRSLHLQGYDTAYTTPSTPTVQGSLTLRNGEIILDEGGFILIP